MQVHAAFSCFWLCLAGKVADPAAGPPRLSLELGWALPVGRGVSAGCPPPCSVHTMCACDRDVGQERVDSHLEIKVGSLDEAAFGMGSRVYLELARSTQAILAEGDPASSSDLLCDLSKARPSLGLRLLCGLDGGTNPCPRGPVRQGIAICLMSYTRETTAPTLGTAVLLTDLQRDGCSLLWCFRRKGSSRSERCPLSLFSHF